jgi:hypothetical protein
LTTGRLSSAGQSDATRRLTMMKAGVPA